MRVYVESNFVLELVLEQEQSPACEQIVALAEAGRLRLVVPAFCLVEPLWTLNRRKQERRELAERMGRELRELGRTATLAQEVASLRATTAVLVRSLDEAARRFETVVSRLMAAADVVPLTPEVIQAAFGHRAAYGLSDPDSLVLASVLADLPGKPGPGCFLNRNTRDFSDPALVAALTAQNCHSIPRFDDGVRFLHAQLPPPP